MDLELHEWIMAGLAAFSLGLSKSGIKGISTIIVTIMAIVFGGKSSTGVLLPLLIVGDIFAVIYYRRHVQWNILFKLLPWMIIGVLLGVWFGRDIEEKLFKQIMASIILFSVVMMYWWDKRKKKTVPDNIAFAGSMGLAAGFTTMLGNLAGAFSNIFFLAMRLPKNEFIGTAAWLFFFVNLFKLPFHIFSWKTVTWESVQVNLYLIPAIILGLWAGIHILKRINNELFRNMILILTAIGAVVILFR
ncbi:MAG: putative membrane protein YfcA [Cognaticolwellia sp.]|jgi:uncharacterized membrane protein YfcA|tara:strand:- start:386 stop:1123 length:738 start_codon:yes stop_codon:yes gene_type:complete